MSFCPEHGYKMVCRNPDAYDGLVYDCPDGHSTIYEDGSYTDVSHPAYADMDFAQSQEDSPTPEESLPHTQPAHTQTPQTGMQDVMVVRGNQLVAKEYAQEEQMNNHSNTLTEQDIEELKDLGWRISLSLGCDINNSGVPCRTDRLTAVELMRQYVEIHDS